MTPGPQSVLAALGGSRGSIMLESIIAITVLVTTSIATLTGLSALNSARPNLERMATAENLLRNQMEYVFSLDYQPAPHTYPSITSTPAGFGVIAVATEYVAGDPEVQIVTVTVTVTHGTTTNDILEVETVRIGL